MPYANFAPASDKPSKAALSMIIERLEWELDHANEISFDHDEQLVLLYAVRLAANDFLVRDFLKQIKGG